MIKEILLKFTNNLQGFFVVWAVVVIINQIFIFGACFAPYCLVAALPHTFVISLLINYFFLPDVPVKKNQGIPISEKPNKSRFTRLKNQTLDREFEDTQIPCCPKCGSKMILRTAKNGQHIGNKFWGCSTYPKCRGLLNL